MSEIRAAIDDLVSRGRVDPIRLGGAFAEIMDGEAASAAAAGLLIALRMKGETVEEIVAVARALRARSATAKASDPRTIDTCGTGGSGIDTFNISTTAAFVVAGAGVPVAKHGNRAATSRSGSFDVLEALGVRIDLPIERYAEILEQIGIAPFFARTAHPAFRHVAPVRAELGVRTLLNCLGPLLSPVGALYQVVGVYSAALVESLAGALAELGAKRALVVHGSDGMDELTTTGPSSAALVSGGRVETMKIDPQDLGLERAKLEDLAGGTPGENALTTRAILAGEIGAQRDIVLLNAAAALWVVEEARTLEAGIEIAARSVDEGAAAAKLEALAKATTQAGEGSPA
ncbi:MAG: anthranilate phosphoribosyltransferase [bacterium]|nr:anthranilate phosphoribosyltransferase [Deltaproteobacteria bacterium]MCP4909000.1 anthranilate phosphoribosyltransferase [bacterium]